MQIRSVGKFIRLAINCKLWADKRPTVDVARPARCVQCGVRSVIGTRVVVHGHGRRDRQQRGPVRPAESPTTEIVRLRRYQCQRCGAVMTCAPEQVQKHKHFSAGAIAWALGLFGLLQMSAAEVRAQTSPWRVVGSQNGERWATLMHWARQVRERTLFASARRSPQSFTLRQVAGRCAQSLSALARSPYATAPPPARAFYGAARAR